LTAIGPPIALSTQSQRLVFPPWHMVAAEAVEGTGGRGHQGGAREAKTAMDGRLAGRRRPSLRGYPKGSGYGTRGEYQVLARSKRASGAGSEGLTAIGLWVRLLAASNRV